MSRSESYSDAAAVRLTSWRQVALATIIAGPFAAVAEMVIVLPIQARLGASPERVFQSIAFGALGRAAFHEGLGSALLGVFFHLLISVVAAGLYAAAAVRRPILLNNPVLGGILYGAACYVFMTFVVIPLSAIGFQLSKSPVLLAMSIAVHLFAFGLPLALAVTASIRRLRQ